MLCLIVILQLDDQYLSDNREKNETLDNYYYLKNPSKNNLESLLDENKINQNKNLKNTGMWEW